MKTMKRKMETIFWSWQAKSKTDKLYLKNNWEMVLLLKPVSSLHTTEFIKCLFDSTLYVNKKKNMYMRAVFFVFAMGFLVS